MQVGLPVLEGALERSVSLAAAMDARGYGRTAEVPDAVRRTTAALTLGGLLGVCAGTYGLLTAAGGGYGLPVLLAGLASALAGLWLGGRRTLRTRYRPDPWDVRAWLVSASGAAVAALLVLAGSLDPGALNPGVVPLEPPALPLWPAAAVLLGLLPAFVTPPPRRPATPQGADDVIRFENVSVTYDGAARPAVRDVDLEVPEGELVLLVGPSGVGKSTVLGAVSGLVPHFTGGTLHGRVTVAGRDTRTHKPRELADVVGTVGQDPLSTS